MRDAPMTGGRSPVKNNAFRTLRTGKKKYCICGRALMWLKDSDAWVCGECGRTEYLEQKQQQLPVSNSGIGSIDGLSDSNLRPTRGATKFHSKDPRARFLKPKSEIDDELRAMAEAGGWTIKRYDQRIEQSGEVLTQEELRANK